VGLLDERGVQHRGRGGGRWCRLARRRGRWVGRAARDAPQHLGEQLQLGRGRLLGATPELGRQQRRQAGLEVIAIGPGSQEQVCDEGQGLLGAHLRHHGAQLVDEGAT
jgi:hypothetical protein